MACSLWSHRLALCVPPLLIPPRDHTCARRHALRCSHVAAGKAHAVARKLIEVRRADFRIRALRAEIRPSVIVGVNEEDVRLPFRSVRGRADCEEEKELAHGRIHRDLRKCHIRRLASRLRILADHGFPAGPCSDARAAHISRIRGVATSIQKP